MKRFQVKGTKDGQSVSAIVNSRSMDGARAHAERAGISVGRIEEMIDLTAPSPAHRRQSTLRLTPINEPEPNQAVVIAVATLTATAVVIRRAASIAFQLSASVLRARKKQRGQVARQRRTATGNIPTTNLYRVTGNFVDEYDSILVEASSIAEAEHKAANEGCDVRTVTLLRSEEQDEGFAHKMNERRHMKGVLTGCCVKRKPIRIKYAGGTNADTERKITPISVDDQYLKALSNGEERTFVIDRIRYVICSDGEMIENEAAMDMPPARSAQRVAELRQAMLSYREQHITDIAAAGWHVEWTEEEASIHDYFKNGKPKKGATLFLIMNPEDNPPSFEVCGDDVGRGRRFKHIDKAVEYFVQETGRCSPVGRRKQ